MLAWLAIASVSTAGVRAISAVDADTWRRDEGLIPAVADSYDQSAWDKKWLRDERRLQGQLAPSLLDETHAVEWVHPVTLASTGNETNSTEDVNTHILDWTVLSGYVLILCVVDFFFFQKMVMSFRNKAMVILFWVAGGLLFVVYMWQAHGPAEAAYWLNGYYLEYMLSVDNLLAYRVIFSSFLTPPVLVHKALSVGIGSVALFRLLLFLTIGPAFQQMRWVHNTLAVILIASGAMSVATSEEDGEALDTHNMLTVRCLKQCLGTRLWEGYDVEDHGVMVAREGQTCASLLLVVIAVIECADVMFAFDSVSAKVSVMPNVFVAYSSTILACLGLRSLYFILNDMAVHFVFLKYGVGFSLIFIGVALLASDWYPIPDWCVCAVTAAALGATIPVSLLVKPSAKEDKECAITVVSTNATSSTDTQ
mmetsp:Transcript_51427/g.95141  ORF Transcript_51427/g.95141 Transcript_51427/m.95141 type:complete len:423 (+) Transcript_51427:21-1289(+)